MGRKKKKCGGGGGGGDGGRGRRFEKISETTCTYKQTNMQAKTSNGRRNTNSRDTNKRQTARNDKQPQTADSQIDKH